MHETDKERDELNPNDPTRKTVHPDSNLERGGGEREVEGEGDLQRRQSEGNLGNERNRNNPDEDRQEGASEDLTR
jgi:hypothetical protein